MPDLRGGGGAVQQLAQLGGVGQQAQPQVPGLLQMAQAAMDGGGGLSAFSANDIPFGAEVRPITSPQDQNWSDAQGRPIHVGGKPPAYHPGTTFGGYNAVFDPQNTASTNAGWFTLDDYFNQAPTPMQAAGWGPQDAGEGRGGGASWASPTSGGMQSPQRYPKNIGANNNALSTNNWRLLPQGFNDPDHFMFNGTIVSRTKARDDLAPKSVLGQEGGGFPGWWPMGTGVWGTPISSHGWTQGPIGSGQLMTTSTPTY